MTSKIPSNRSPAIPTGPDPAQSVGYILWQLTHKMHQQMIEELNDLGLIPAQVGALAHIARQEAISNAELARMLLMTPQNMSLTTAKLQEAGYVRKTAHETHGRITRLEITDTGVNCLLQATQRMAKVEQRMMAHMTTSERDHFQDLLEQSLQALKSDR